MKIANIRDSDAEFHILQTTARLQTATMMLVSGAATSDKMEVHSDSDQLVVVLEGELVACIGSEEARLAAGQTLIVPAGAPHRFYNAGPGPAFAFTAYAPPAWPEDA